MYETTYWMMYIHADHGRKPLNTIAFAWSGQTQWTDWSTPLNCQIALAACCCVQWSCDHSHQFLGALQRLLLTRNPNACTAIKV